jgi:hypothetical protein
MSGVLNLDSYSRHNQDFPQAVFRELYAIEADSTVGAAVGWWKRSRVEAAIRDRFATGVVLGMTIDMAAKAA